MSTLLTPTEYADVLAARQSEYDRMLTAAEKREATE